MSNTYPDAALILEKAHIVRFRTLPDGVAGEILVRKGTNVTPDDVIAWGTRASQYLIIDVAAALGMNPEKDAAKLEKVLTLRAGASLKEGDPLGKSDNRAITRRLPKAPMNAVVSLVERGRVILQVNPETVEVKARMTGEVVEVVDGLGAEIETYGSVVQGVWGNGHFFAGRFTFEPGTEGSEREVRGLADLLKLDLALSPYTNKAMVLLRPITTLDLEVVQAHELAGLVAPSMPPHLREKAMQLKVPIILTEGFGNLPPTKQLYDLLYERRSVQASFDASLPDLRRGVRPEIIMPGGISKVESLDPHIDKPLEVGLWVRLRRAPHSGRVGIITDLPEAPLRLENGLRVLAARVKLPAGDEIVVPQANLESLGKAAQAEIR